MGELAHGQELLSQQVQELGAAMQAMQATLTQVSKILGKRAAKARRRSQSPERRSLLTGAASTTLAASRWAPPQTPSGISVRVPQTPPRSPQDHQPGLI